MKLYLGVAQDIVVKRTIDKNDNRRIAGNLFNHEVVGVTQTADSVSVEVRGDPLYIQRDTGSLVMISEEEFEGLVETAHLLSSPANASRLLASMKAAEAGELHAHRLTEQGSRGVEEK